MKKVLLILGMFLFMTNVNALTFDINLTNIEDKGNNGTIGSIEKIDQDKKELDVYFQDIGDEVNFELTFTNTGDRAGTLRSIEATSTNNKIEYTSNLPDGGLAINGNDTNKVIITAKVKEGAVNGTSSSEIKITYNYDEGSCPDGEILSSDETMCLCPEGLERNETGVCIKPEKKIECATGEIYNETKKICEKKAMPINPSNPKTMDNIVLISLLFIVSGLGIYAAMYKKLDTNKKRVTGGVITGVITLGATFTVLVSVFGLDKLLAAIVNPITKKTEITITVNEKIELIETWDGECSLDVASLTPQNIFEGGSGTESDPYQIKTAEQLSCFAKSVNNGTTYEGKYIKQTKNIKLNNKVLENVEAGTTNDLNTWTPIGNVEVDSTNNTVTVTKVFKGTYDGDNKVISGMYINNTTADCLGLFRTADATVIKNLILSDNYINGHKYIGTLIGYALENSKVENVKTYGELIGTEEVAGIIGSAPAISDTSEYIRIDDSENYSNITAINRGSGIATSYTMVVNSKNYGNVIAIQNASGISSASCYVFDSENHGDITGEGYVAGIGTSGVTAFGSDNYGKITGQLIDGTGEYKNFFSGILVYGAAFDCNNFGDIETTIGTYPIGFAANGSKVYNSGNTGTISAHDYTTEEAVSVSAMVACSSNMISDEAAASDPSMQVYYDVMGKDFVSENKSSYNSGDVYVSDISARNFSVTMIGSTGVGSVYNAHNTGSMYLSNLTSNQYGSTFTMIATDGGTYTNTSSVGDMIVDNYYGTEGDSYFVGIGTSGSTVKNSYSEGTIEIKNSTIGGGPYNYNTAYISGGTTSGAYMENSYTKGEILIHDNNFPAFAQVGGITGSGSGADKSYSEKDIEVYNNSATTLIVGGLGTAGGRGVSDGYNRGNINVHDNSATTLKVAGGPAGEMYMSKGNYNSGDVYVKDNFATAIQLGGSISWNYFSNFYNLGNITFETENNTKLTSLEVGGVNVRCHGSSGSNLVNTGDITIPYVSTITKLAVGGVYSDLSSNPSTNVYNTGKITIASGYTYSDNINFGNVYGIKTSVYDASTDTPTSYYTGDGYAMGLSRLSSANAALDTHYATKINSSQVPGILDIINVDNAFEIKEGETLPTLKVFN